MILWSIPVARTLRGGRLVVIAASPWNEKVSVTLAAPRDRQIAMPSQRLVPMRHVDGSVPVSARLIPGRSPAGPTT